jgi:membrane protein implicated in regulation of membrane protease activity
MVTFEEILALSFLVIGLVLLVAEAASPGFFVGVIATILIALALLGLFIPGFFTSPLAPITVIAVGAPVTYLTILLYQRLAPPSPPITTVGESLIGRRGRVVRRVIPDSIAGKVNIDNTVWSATAEEPIAKGVRVQVVDSRGVHVVVTPWEAKAAEKTTEKEEKREE